MSGKVKTYYTAGRKSKREKSQLGTIDAPVQGTMAVPAGVKDVNFSKHAKMRMKQRNISTADIGDYMIACPTVFSGDGCAVVKTAYRREERWMTYSYREIQHCVYCGFEFDTLVAEYEHEWKHHNGECLVCHARCKPNVYSDHCQSCFETPEGKRYWDNPENSLRCKVCAIERCSITPSTYFDLQDLNKHMKKEHLCLGCHKLFHKKKSLEQHIQQCAGMVTLKKRESLIIVPVKRYECTSCSKKFESSELCVAHFDLKHRKKADELCQMVLNSKSVINDSSAEPLRYIDTQKYVFAEFFRCSGCRPDSQLFRSQADCLRHFASAVGAVTQRSRNKPTKCFTDLALKHQAREREIDESIRAFATSANEDDENVEGNGAAEERDCDIDMTALKLTLQSEWDDEEN